MSRRRHSLPGRVLLLPNILLLLITLRSTSLAGCLVTETLGYWVGEAGGAQVPVMFSWCHTTNVPRSEHGHRIRRRHRHFDQATLSFLVDSGTKYTLLPYDVWREIGLQPAESLTFILADGTDVERRVGEWYSTLPQGSRHTPVVLGQEGDDRRFLVR